MKVFYRNIDITNSVNVLSCVHDMYAERQADTLRIQFDDEEKVWDDWKPAKNDLIRILSDDVDSGNMYVSKLKYRDGFLYLTACSVPETFYSVNTKTWKDTSFLQIAKDLAKKHGLKFKSYSVTDKKYKFQQQNKISDALFLNQLCSLEGVAFLIYDQTLTLYDEQAFDKKQAVKSLTLEDNEIFDLETKDPYGNCLLSAGQFKGSYKHGSSALTCVPDFEFQVSSQAEANRFAKNFLRYVNKSMSKGYKEFIGIDAGLAPCSVINLETTQAKSWNGPVFLTRVRNDYIHQVSKVFFRKPLEGY